MANNKPIVVSNKTHKKLSHLKWICDVSLKELAEEIMREALNNKDIVKKVVAKFVKDPQKLPTDDFYDKFVNS